MEHIPIAILGAGVAGLSAATAINRHSDHRCRVYESSHRAGGISSSFTVGGATFDMGIHALYGSTTHSKSLDPTAGIEGTGQIVSISDYSAGLWARHPIYLNLAQLPKERIVTYLTDFFDNAVNAPRSSVKRYDEWCLNHFGPRISEDFLFPYARKFWAVSPSELTTSWMGSRVKIPSISEIVEGALLEDPRNTHYVQRIWYPKIGGFGSYASTISDNVDIAYGCSVEVIDAGKRSVVFGNGREVTYSRIISTIPLPVLIESISDAPKRVRTAASELRATAMTLVSIGIDRPNAFASHWTYVYDYDIPFARLSCPSKWATSNAPEGATTLQAEIYTTGSAVSDPTATFDAVVRGLVRMGVISDQDRIIFRDVRTVPRANVIYDHNRERGLSVVSEFLKKKQIWVCGRYGFWDYSLIDEVVRRAHSVAEEVIRDIEE